MHSGHEDFARTALSKHSLKYILYDREINYNRQKENEVGLKCYRPAKGMSAFGGDGRAVHFGAVAINT